MCWLQVYIWKLFSSITHLLGFSDLAFGCVLVGSDANIILKLCRMCLCLLPFLAYERHILVIKTAFKVWVQIFKVNRSSTVQKEKLWVSEHHPGIRVVLLFDAFLMVLHSCWSIHLKQGQQDYPCKKALLGVKIEGELSLTVSHLAELDAWPDMRYSVCVGSFGFNSF